jgi:hypothetical protein
MSSIEDAPLRPFLVVFFFVAKQLFGVMEAIGPQFSAILVRRRDPFSLAVFAFSGGPAAGFDEGMVGSAGEGERVHVGAMGGCPFLDVVKLASVSGYDAAGVGAPTVFGAQHNPLPSAGHPTAGRHDDPPPPP